MKDYIAKGIPCAFFNFKGSRALECKIRRRLKDLLKVDMDHVTVNQSIIDFFKADNINNVVCVVSTHVCFWRV